MLKRYALNATLPREGVDVFSGYYARQNNDREAINVVNKVFNGDAWSIVSKQKNVVVGKTKLRVEETLLRRSDGTDRLVWRWYNVGGKNVGDPVMAKLYNFPSFLAGRPDITMFVIATDIIEDRNRAFDRLQIFFEDNERIFSTWVEVVRSMSVKDKL